MDFYTSNCISPSCFTSGHLHTLSDRRSRVLEFISPGLAHEDTPWPLPRNKPRTLPVNTTQPLGFPRTGIHGEQQAKRPQGAASSVLVLGSQHQAQDRVLQGAQLGGDDHTSDLRFCLKNSNHVKKCTQARLGLSHPWQRLHQAEERGVPAGAAALSNTAP